MERRYSNDFGSGMEKNEKKYLGGRMKTCKYIDFGGAMAMGENTVKSFEVG